MAIIIKDKHISDATSSGRSVSEVIAKAYEGEIAERITKDSRLAKLDPIEMAMMDAGISKSSRIQDFYRTNGNEWLFPVFIDRTLHELLGNSDILNHLISSAPVSVPSNSIMGSYIDLTDENNKKGVRVKRVAEGTELPLASITLGSRAITLSKFGRAVQATYEALQYQSVDLFTRTIGYIANDAAHQQVEAAIDVLINGDGNDNAATVDTMASATLSVDDIINEAMVFYDNGMQLTTVVVGKELYITLQKMMFNNTAVNGILPGATFAFPQGVVNGLTVLYDPNIPDASGKKQMLCLDNRYALTKYVAAGSQIREIDRNIKNQTQIGTISEIAGFSKSLKNGARLLKQGT